MKFEGEGFDAHTLLKRMYTHIHGVSFQIQPKREPSLMDSISLEGLNCAVRKVGVKKGRWLCWNKPVLHAFKLNVDGAFKGGVSAGGGILQDRNGDFMWGFSVPYLSEDSTEAEILALYGGLKHCVETGMIGISIETDTSMVVNMLRDASSIPWHFVYLIRRVKSLLMHVGEVKLIFREQNMAADKLAKMAFGAMGKKVFNSIHEVPRSVQKIIFLDRVGILNFRSPCN